MKYFLTVSFTVFLTALFAQSISIKRGPYLNKATQDEITVRYRTTEPCQAWVQYYKDGNMHRVETTVSDSDHVVTLGGLEPGSRYRYECGCKGNEAPLHTPTEDYNFRTLPADDYDGPVNIWAIGDFGTGSQDQTDVKDAYVRYMQQQGWETDVWLQLGDNAYGDGTDLEYQTNNFEMYPDLYRNLTVWPAPGNHDYKSVDIITHDGPYYDIFTLPTQGESGGLASGSEYYYSFDYGDVHFVCLNSEWSPWIYVPAASPMQLWLAADLALNDKKWKIVYWHQPPYTKGSHDSDDPFGIMNMFRQNIVPIMELGGIDLGLSGHSHVYERSMLINGHYGYSFLWNENLNAVDASSGRPADGTPYYKATEGLQAGRGTVYNVVGNSGKVSDSGTMDHPIMVYNDNVNMGSVAIRVHGDTLTSRYVTTSGEVLDEYQIIKSPDGTPGNSTAVNELPAQGETQLELRNQFGKQWLAFEVFQPTAASLAILDASGKEVAVLLEKTELNSGNRMYPIPTNLSPGTYIGVLKMGWQKRVVKFMVQ